MATIRMFWEGNEPWFVAEDVYYIANGDMEKFNLRDIEEADKKLVRVQTQDGEQLKCFINEPAFYEMFLRGASERSDEFWKFFKREALSPLLTVGFTITDSLSVSPWWERMATIEIVTPII